MPYLASDWWFYRDDTPETLTYHIPLSRLQQNSQQILAEYLDIPFEDIETIKTLRTSDDKLLIDIETKSGSRLQYTGRYTEATLVLE